MVDMTLIADLVRAGLDPDLIGRVANALVEAASAAACGISGGISGGIPVDLVAEKRRAFDRKRKRAAKARELSGGIPVEKKEEKEKNEKKGLPHTPSKEKKEKKEKKESIGRARARDIDLPTRLPEDWTLPEEWRAYARSKGLSEGEIDLQAERFRNHAHINNRTCRNWFAAWRNWVTSPYLQPKGMNNGQGYQGVHIVRPSGGQANSIGAALGRAAQRFHEIASGSGEVAGREDEVWPTPLRLLPQR